MLPVSAPFHSAMMGKAAEIMAAALDRVEKKPPVVPVIPNVRVQPLTDPDQITLALIDQVTGRVRWRETVEWFAAHGVSSLYEIGAGKVLTGLARRIDRNIAAQAVNTPADVQAAVAALA